MKASEVAKTFVGEKEKPGNSGFYNQRLQELMTKAGHKTGEAWCCYFAEACFVEAAGGDTTERGKLLRTLFSANCVQTWKNFVKAGFKTSMTPVVGALVIFQRRKNGVPTSQGHAAIVKEFSPATPNIFTSIEGNTNSTGSREGDSVQIKRRSMAISPNGLNPLGFVIIEE